MKTYLTSEEFANLFFSKYETKIKYGHPELGDRILWAMFQQYEKDVKETLEGSMWGVDEYTGESAIDVIGCQFHKSFRQTDVIPAKHIDGIVWQCINDAPMFWRVMEKVCKILTSESAAEIYRDEMYE